VNGKVRANIVASPKAKEDEVADLSKKDQKVASYLKGGEVIKQIFVPSKLINFVVK
jgi:leucyl-tRNA synthetase